MNQKWLGLGAALVLLLNGCGRNLPAPQEYSGDYSRMAYIETAKPLSYGEWEQILSLPEVTDYDLSGREGAMSDELTALGDRAEHGAYLADHPLGDGRTEAPHFYLTASRRLTAEALEQELDLVLIDGEIPSPDGKGQCLISEPLARLNHKSVGDKILLQNWLDPKKTVRVKIAGIYKGPEGGEIMDERLKDSLADEPMNGIFVTVADLRKLTKGAEREGVWQVPSLTLDAPASIGKVREEIEKLGLSDSVKLYTAEELMDRMMGGGDPRHRDDAAE